MSLAIDLLSWILLLAGGVFSIIGAVGLLRMPDFYTRLHAASVTDTLGAGLLLAGLLLQAGFTLVAVKLLFLALFIFFTSPAAAHALARAALDRGLSPVLRPGRARIEALIINVLMTLMAALVLAMIAQRNLFSVIVLASIYSFIMASVLVALDAVDVAMTEASVGAGISTVLLLAALHLSRSDEAKPLHRPTLPTLVSVAVAAALVFGALGLPPFSDPDAPMQQHVAPRYLAESVEKTGVPNVVTAVLASYRGYDTLGETTVVFTAGAGVVALLRRRRKPPEDGR